MSQSKLAVTYPGDCPIIYMAAFHSLMQVLPVPNYETKWFRGLGFCQARRRNHMVEQAIEWGADLIVSLDIDQVYPPDILQRLVARTEQGYRCVSALVPCRGRTDSLARPFDPSGWKLVDKHFTQIDLTEADDDGMIQAEFPTTACNIMHAEDVAKLSRPWYAYKYNPETWEETEGEDSRFYLRLGQEVGVKCYVDTTIKVKHCQVFQIDETFPDRFPDWETSH